MSWDFSNKSPTPVSLTEKSLEDLLTVLAASCQGPITLHPDRMIVSPDIAHVSRAVGIPDRYLTFRDCQLIYSLIEQFGRDRAIEEFRLHYALPAYPERDCGDV